MEIKRRGFTLVELIIYFFLSVLVLGLVASMFTVAKRTQQHTYAQYLVGGPIADTIRLLQKELQSTALTSVQAFPQNGGGERPGMSCASAFDSDGAFSLSGYGTPHWQKHVFYFINEEGSLIRWTRDYTDAEKDMHLPVRPTNAPSDHPGGGRPVMPGLLQPNTEVEKYQPATPYGGFEVGFVRRAGGAESVSPVNPSDSTDYPAHTRLVQVTLRTHGERNPSFSEIKFRVCPRY